MCEIGEATFGAAIYRLSDTSLTCEYKERRRKKEIEDRKKERRKERKKERKKQRKKETKKERMKESKQD